MSAKNSMLSITPHSATSARSFTQLAIEGTLDGGSRSMARGHVPRVCVCVRCVFVFAVCCLQVNKWLYDWCFMGVGMCTCTRVGHEQPKPRARCKTVPPGAS